MAASAINEELSQVRLITFIAFLSLTISTFIALLSLTLTTTIAPVSLYSTSEKVPQLIKYPF